MQINSIPDFMGDVYDLLYYVTGNAQIFRGNQSREVLPADNNYIVYTPILQKRIGTNIAVLDADGVAPEDDAPETNSKLLQIDLQIDFYGANAFSFAEGLETFSKAARCNDWLIQNDMGIRVLYASDPIDGTLVDDTQQYIPRRIVTLSICTTVSTTDSIPWVEDVQVNVVPQYDPEPSPEPTPDPPIPPSQQKGDKLINIDVVYPPKKEE